MLIRKPILMYHSTSPDSTLRVNVTPDSLEEHLDLLKRIGFKPGSVRDVLDHNSNHNIAITFDDGYANNIDILPLLKRYNAGATFFVLTDSAGETLSHHQPYHVPLMGPYGWRAIQEAGFEVAAHGRTHARLTELDAADQQREIIESIGAIRKILGVSEVGYAYPYGSMTETACRAARRHAAYACATRYRYPLLENRWRLRRINVVPADTVDRLRLKLNPVFRLICDMGF